MNLRFSTSSLLMKLMPASVLSLGGPGALSVNVVSQSARIPSLGGMPTILSNDPREGNFLDPTPKDPNIGGDNIAVFGLSIGGSRLVRQSIHHLPVFHVIVPLIVAFQFISAFV